MKKNQYACGDCLCDMHYGFRHLPDNLDVVEHFTFRNDNASAAVQAMFGGKHPGNKILCVFSDDPCFSGAYDLAACYAYDGATFGIVTLKYKEQQWTR